MRGKDEKLKERHGTAGITPAYAGKRTARFIRKTPFWDHPRLCGEKSDMLEKITWNLGSPPPMRGKVAERLYYRRVSGITPAYAGKSLHRPLRCRPLWDHPRLCGEKTKKIPKQRYFFHQPASFSFSLQYT